jgi:hypothetical protein
VSDSINGGVRLDKVSHIHVAELIRGYILRGAQLPLFNSFQNIKEIRTIHNFQENQVPKTFGEDGN